MTVDSQHEPETGRMDEESFVNYNGKIFSSKERLIQLSNRAFRYGDGLFETIRIHEGEILFFADHMDRMLSGMKALQIIVPDYYSSFFFHKQIVELGYKNQVQGNARIRITICREGNGLYEPVNSSAEYFIEVSMLNKGFEWMNEGCVVNVAQGVEKNYSSFSFIKSLNALPYVMAALYKKNNRLGDCILINSHNNIADAISSNVFWIEKEMVFTPPLSDGGIDGIMRKNLIRILKNNNISVEEKSINAEDLKSADEIFLTNVVWGIKPITEMVGKKFSTSITKELFELLLKTLSFDAVAE